MKSPRTLASKRSSASRSNGSLASNARAVEMGVNLDTHCVVSRKKAVKVAKLPKFTSRRNRVTRTKAVPRYTTRAQQQAKVKAAASECIAALTGKQRVRGVGVRGQSRRRISAVRVLRHWRQHERSLGQCPSLRTVYRLVRGVNTPKERHGTEEQMSQQQFQRYGIMSSLMGWG